MFGFAGRFTRTRVVLSDMINLNSYPFTRCQNCSPSRSPVNTIKNVGIYAIFQVLTCGCVCVLCS